jgi:hypothetical protein
MNLLNEPAGCLQVSSIVSSFIVLTVFLRLFAAIRTVFLQYLCLSLQAQSGIKQIGVVDFKTLSNLFFRHLGDVTTGTWICKDQN